VLAAAVVLLNFFIPRLLPGDPLTFSSGEGLDASAPMSAAAKEQLRVYYHLDEPTSRQLLAYLGDLARGDLGWSIARPSSVGALIAARLWWTLGLLLVSLGVSLVVGVSLGLAAGRRPGRRGDRLLVSGMAALAAVPEFLVAIGLLAVFSTGLGWVPLLGGQTAFISYGGDASGLLSRTLDIVSRLTLPAATLVLVGAAGFVLVARDAAAGTQGAPWLIVARAKGLRERSIAVRHVLPNIAFPLTTYLALRLGALFGGALVVERVFSVPGLGLLAYQSIRARDYPVLQALFLLSGLGVLVANFGLELLYLRLDRRRGTSHA